MMIHLYSIFWSKLFADCRTSLTDDGGKGKGKLNSTCQFPFIVKGVTYYSCTYDYGWVTGNKPWCSTKTDENSKHQSGQWGVCDDYEKCHIPTRCKFFLKSEIKLHMYAHNCYLFQFVENLLVMDLICLLMKMITEKTYPSSNFLGWYP